MADPIYSQVDKFFPIKYSHIQFISNFAFPVICKTAQIRDELVEKCKDIIEIRPIVGGDMTRQPFSIKYMKEFAHVLQNSNAKLVHDQGLYFGNNPEMNEEEKEIIVNIFTK